MSDDLKDRIAELEQEVARLQEMIVPLVFCLPSSQAWDNAMNAIGYYITDELGIDEDEWAKRQAAKPEES